MYIILIVYDHSPKLSLVKPWPSIILRVLQALELASLCVFQQTFLVWKDMHGLTVQHQTYDHPVISLQIETQKPMGFTLQC